MKVLHHAKEPTERREPCAAQRVALSVEDGGKGGGEQPGREQPGETAHGAPRCNTSSSNLMRRMFRRKLYRMACCSYDSEDFFFEIIWNLGILPGQRLG